MNDYDKITTPLTGEDLKKYLKDPKIIKYSELSEYNRIEDLLKEKKDYVILLVEQAINIGHWQLLMRIDKTIYFFCSYGTRVDKALIWTKEQMRKELDQNYPSLSYLLNKSLKEGFKVIFNGYSFQSKHEDIATCGYWVVAIIKYFLYSDIKNPTFCKFKNMIDELKDKYELNNDLLVVKLVNKNII